jgi:hypothetical protein
MSAEETIYSKDDLHTRGPINRCFLHQLNSAIFDAEEEEDNDKLANKRGRYIKLTPGTTV